MGQRRIIVSFSCRSSIILPPTPVSLQANCTSNRNGLGFILDEEKFEKINQKKLNHLRVDVDFYYHII